MWEKNLNAIFSFPLTVAAPDLLDPKSATHNTKPRLSFSTKPITLTPREESEVREKKKEVQILKVILYLFKLKSSPDVSFWHHYRLFQTSCMYVG